MEQNERIRTAQPRRNFGTRSAIFLLEPLWKGRWIKAGIHALILVGILMIPALFAADDRPQSGAGIAARFSTEFKAPPKKGWGHTGGGVRLEITRDGSRATDAPLLGNGDLGVCITGTPDKQRFWFTKNDFWRLDKVAAVPMSFGTLNVSIPTLAGADYSVRQSLVDATTVARFKGKTSTVTQTSFVAAGANVLVVALSCEGEPVEVSVALAPNQAGGDKKHTITTGKADGCLWSTRTQEGLALPLAATTAWRMEGTKTPSFTLMPGKTVRVLLSMVTNFDAADHQRNAVTMAKQANAASLLEEHKAWWRDFYDRSFVEIPDADIMRAYYLSHYTVACASRNPSFPPAIIGPWLTAEFGWCAYWMNYNHTSPFYGLYTAGHFQQADPHDTPILEYMPEGRKHAKAITGCRGILYPVGIGPRGLDASGMVADLKRDDKKWENGVMTWGQRSNAAYQMVNMGQRWYKTLDPEYGKKIYPFVLEVVSFWEDYLKLEDTKNGQRYVILDDSVQEGTGNNKNPVNSIALVRHAMKLALDMSSEMGVDEARRAKWLDICNRLSDFPTRTDGKTGETQFILTEQGPSHWRNNTVRIQHIYPGGAIGLDSPADLLETARNTIKGMRRWHDGNGSNSFFPAAVRVGHNPNEILKELHRMSAGRLYPNGFVAGNIHGIENCSTVPNTVQEMLLQSHSVSPATGLDGPIRLFPVWPRDRDARFGSLRAHGAFQVSAELKDGVVRGVKIVSLRGRNCTVENPWPGSKVTLTSDGRTETLSGERLTFKTHVGEAINLAAQSQREKAD